MVFVFQICNCSVNLTDSCQFPIHKSRISNWQLTSRTGANPEQRHVFDADKLKKYVVSVHTQGQVLVSYQLNQMI